MGHLYINNSFTAEQESKIRSSVGPSRYFENFLTQDEFVFCRSFFERPIDWPEHGQVSKYWGFGWEHGYGPELVWLKTKLDAVLPNWKLDFFALQETIQPWKIHADIRWYPDKLPYKVIIIPLDVVPESGPTDPKQWPDTFTVAFHQMNFMSAATNDNSSRHGNDQKLWKRPIENPNVEGRIEGFHVDQSTWQKHFTHFDYDHLEGLTIDAMHLWRPGSMLWHDNAALHCADNWLNKGIQTKKCLMVFTVLDIA